MPYSEADICEYISTNDVKFIRLAFCDIYGRQKNVSIMPGELGRAFSDGVSIDASAVAGFGSEERSDLFLYPDPSTLSLLPWRPSHGRVVRFFCDIKHPDGTPFELDSRLILRRAVADAKRAGVVCTFGAECEFYLFKTDENGYPTNEPYDRAGYLDIAPDDRGENVRREICLALSDMGIVPECSHHEEGPGQNEIDFKYSDPLTSADNLTAFKAAVGTIASISGVYASFAPKPIAEKPGNGLHINVSVDGGEKQLMPFMAGVLAHISEMTAFLNPCEESYKRLGAFKAPKYITWSRENRSPLIRIPASHGGAQRIELRSPDPSANPYIAFALIIRAGLDGVTGKMAPPPETDINLCTASPEQVKSLPALPLSLRHASLIAGQSPFIRDSLPSRFISGYKFTDKVL